MSPKRISASRIALPLRLLLGVAVLLLPGVSQASLSMVPDLIAQAGEVREDPGPVAGPAEDPVPVETPPAERNRVVRPAEPDWAGLARDTGYLLGYQLLAFGILYISPESVSNWSVEDKKDYDFGKWRHNVTHPVWDSDKFYINYVPHPYCGMAYYFDARGRGFGRWGSFVYSFLASDLYEFGTEAFAEPASIQDIFVTPIAGTLLGIWLEDSWARLLAAGEARSWGESTLLFLMDPLGRTNGAVDRFFGFESGRTVVRLLPVIGPAPGRGTYTGIELSMQW